VQLISELQRLGATMVFADFTKIILSTKKKDADDAHSYTQYIISSIANKELFHSIHFEIRHCWEYIIWLDLVSIIKPNNKTKSFCFSYGFFFVQISLITLA
jgi:hypothetical protein